jgi:hypothetical protein
MAEVLETKEMRQWRAKVTTLNFDVDAVGGTMTGLLQRAVELEQERLALISTTWRWSTRRARRTLSTRQPRCGDWLREIRCELGEDSLPKITEALRTWITPVWFYEEHASRIFTELQAQEAA